MILRKILELASDRFYRPGGAPGETVGVLAIMKNEAMNIREWVDHYRWQGVDRIFLIDNGSDDDGKKLIERDIESGFVEYFWRPARNQQVQHYRDVYATAGIESKVTWLAMADLDEFWYSPLGSLKAALELLSPDADLIYSNWRIFGSAGFTGHPPSLREQLLLRRPDIEPHRNTKWICRTRSIVAPRAISIHKVKWVDSRRVLSENALLKLNHYVTQSVEYFTTVKMTRGDATEGRFDNVRDMKYFDAYNSGTTMPDAELANMVIASRKAEHSVPQ